MNDSDRKAGYSNLIVKVIVLLTTVMTFINQFLPDYLNYKRIEALSFMIKDGWCSPSTEGIGDHCFGDYYYPFTFLNTDNPWSGQPNPYNAGSLLIHHFFQELSNNLGPRPTLGLYMLGLVASLVFPIFHLLGISKEISTIDALLLLIVFLGCAPALMAVDRGNTVLLAVPFLYLITRAALGKKSFQVITYSLILVLIKPQFLALGVVLLVIFGLKMFIKWAIFCVILIVTPFIFYYKSFPANIFDWIKQLKSFQSYGSSGTLNPVNMSLKSDLQVVLNILNVSYSQTLLSLVVYLIGALTLIYLILDLKRRNFVHQLASLLFFIILFSGTTFHYYLSILLIPTLCVSLVALGRNDGVFIRNLRESELLQPWVSKKIQAWAFTAFLVANFVPWAIPWSVFDRFYGRGWEAIGINWLPGQFLTAVCGFVVIYSGAPSNLHKTFNFFRSRSTTGR